MRAAIEGLTRWLQGKASGSGRSLPSGPGQRPDPLGRPDDRLRVPPGHGSATNALGTGQERPSPAYLASSV